MRCPICGWIDADYFHIALHQYAQRLQQGIYAVTRPEYGNGPRFFLGEKECAVMTGWAIERGLTVFRNKRIILPETP